MGAMKTELYYHVILMLCIILHMFTGEAGREKEESCKFISS